MLCLANLDTSDYLGSIAVRDYQQNLEKLKTIIFGRKALIYPKKFIDIIFEYLKTGSFWADTSQIQEPEKIVNRHGILHGVFSQFENEELSLKYLILLDTLAFILVADRMATGTL